MTYFDDKNVGEPEWIGDEEKHERARAECGVGVEAAWRVRRRPVRWLIDNVIPDEAVTVIGGEPGAGKTFFGCRLAADMTRLFQFRVVLATAGHEPPELLRSRLDQAQADTRRVALASITPTVSNDRRAGPNDQAIDQRIAVLRQLLLDAGPDGGILPAQIDAPDDSEPTAARLLVIDDVDGWFGKPGQCLSAPALAGVIQRLNQLARVLHVAIVLLVRTQMSAEGRLTSRQLSRLSQSANVVWMIVKDREQGVGNREQGWHALRSSEGRDEVSIAAGASGEDAESPTQPPAYSQSARRWLLPVKNNLAPDVATFGRAFELFDGQIRWHRDDVAPSLAEATLPSVHNSDRRRLRHAAAVWLEEALAAGPLPSKELYRQGVENGFSQGTLKRAATELSIFPHKTGFDGGWEMRWMPQPMVRGRGEMTRRANDGFEAFGADGTSCASSTEREEIDTASCASSMEREEIDTASCASSMERGEIDTASCSSSGESEAVVGATRPHPSPLQEGEGAEASCASSEKCERTAASRETEGEGPDVTCPSGASPFNRGRTGGPSISPLEHSRPAPISRTSPRQTRPPASPGS